MSTTPSTDFDSLFAGDAEPDLVLSPEEAEAMAREEAIADEYDRHVAEDDQR